MDARKITFVQEVYTDEYNTLEQMIMYPSGDIRYRDHLRSEVNPNLTVLKRVVRLDGNLKEIKEYGEENGGNLGWY